MHQQKTTGYFASRWDSAAMPTRPLNIMQDKLLLFLRNNDIQINNYFEATVLLNLIRKKYVISTMCDLDQMRFPVITYLYGEVNGYILDWYYNQADFNIITFSQFVSEYNKHA